jgi:arylsulfatase A-like enzyme
MLRVMSAAYYGAIAHLDQQIGRLLNELERLGMADNTIILFTADHGNMLGDRGRFFKGIMYEGSSHVPLIWRGVKGAAENSGKVIDKIVENTDLLPAILESAGLPVPERVQGRSFLKLMRGQDPQWKDRCYSQLRTAMVRSGRWKLIDNSRDLSGQLELYDMKDDPKEMRNLAGVASQRDRLEDFKRQLTAWRADKPAPVRIAGMKTPEYVVIDPAERKKAIEEAPERALRMPGRKQ